MHTPKMVFGLAALFAAFSTCAADAEPHQLTLHLSGHTAWQQDISTTLSETPENVMMSNGRVTSSFRNLIRTKGTGFQVTREVMTTVDDRKPAADMPGVSGLRADNAALMNRIDYAADATLTPQKITNLADIRHRQHAYEIKTFGGLIANGPDADNNKPTSTGIIAEYLSLDVLMGHLRRTPLEVGVVQTHPDDIADLDGARIVAQTTVTLTKWDETADQAEYDLVTEADPEAKTKAAYRFFLNFLYPLNTMDDEQIADLKKKATLLANASVYTNDIRCHFIASPATGLIISGSCDSHVGLKSRFVSQASASHSDIRQKWLP